MGNIRVGKWLDCGCCGSGFQTWEGYVDQDQDAGYGICKSCQGWIREKDEEEWLKIEKAIRDALSKPENIARWDNASDEDRRIWAMKALDDGIISFKVGKR